MATTHWGWYQVKIKRGVLRVVLHGEFDVEAADELQRALEPLVRQPTAVIEVDMSDVQFFGLHGLRALLESEVSSRSAGTTFRVVAPSPSSQLLFDRAGLGRHFANSFSSN